MTSPKHRSRQLRTGLRWFAAVGSITAALIGVAVGPASAATTARPVSAHHLHIDGWSWN